MSAGGVAAARPASQQAGGGASPTPALHSLLVRCLPFRVARDLLVRHHYLHSFPGGTCLAFGVFVEHRPVGALTLGAGPSNAYALVQGAVPDDCLTLTRLWLADELPPNSESRVLGLVLRNLRKHTSLKFLVSYADPAQGHLGIIYQATNWVYTGLSQATPLYDLGDGQPRHSRSLSHALGTHSAAYLRSQGVEVNLVPQQAKHRYLYFLDPECNSRLKVKALPYPKLEVVD